MNKEAKKKSLNERLRFIRWSEKMIFPRTFFFLSGSSHPWRERERKLCHGWYRRLPSSSNVFSQGRRERGEENKHRKICHFSSDYFAVVVNQREENWIKETEKKETFEKKKKKSESVAGFWWQWVRWNGGDVIENWAKMSRANCAKTFLIGTFFPSERMLEFLSVFRVRANFGFHISFLQYAFYSARVVAS